MANIPNGLYRYRPTIDGAIVSIPHSAITGDDLLSRISRLSPDTIRIMLSGNSDMQSIIATVNTSVPFQFLEKPVSAKRLRSVIRKAFTVYDRQHSASQKTSAIEVA